MRCLNERFVNVMDHKGFVVCVLKEAMPPRDKLGYRIDHEAFKGMVFGLLGDAIAAIDAYL